MLFWHSKGDFTPSGVGITGSAFSTAGLEILESSEVFQDHLFPAGTALRSRFRFMEFGVDGIWGILGNVDDLFTLRLSCGLHYLEAEVHLSGATGTESEEYSDANLKFTLAGEMHPVDWAFAGLRGAVYTDFFSLLVGVNSGHHAGELEVYGGFQLGPVRVEGGCQVFGWSLTCPKSEIDLVTYGPWVSIAVRF